MSTDGLRMASLVLSKGLRDADGWLKKTRELGITLEESGQMKASHRFQVWQHYVNASGALGQ